MPRVSSNWKFTFDPFGSSPVVLLAIGQDTEGEVRFPMRRSFEVVDLAEGSAPFLRLNGNTVTEIELEVYGTESTDKDARQAMLDALLEVQDFEKKPLKIEISGISDRSWIFDDAVLHQLEPFRHLESARPRLAKRYSITASGLDLSITLTAGQTFGGVARTFGQLANTFGNI